MCSFLTSSSKFTTPGLAAVTRSYLVNSWSATILDKIMGRILQKITKLPITLRKSGWELTPSRSLYQGDRVVSINCRNPGRSHINLPRLQARSSPEGLPNLILELTADLLGNFMTSNGDNTYRFYKSQCSHLANPVDCCNERSTYYYLLVVGHVDLGNGTR